VQAGDADRIFYQFISLWWNAVWLRLYFSPGDFLLAYILQFKFTTRTSRNQTGLKSYPNGWKNDQRIKQLTAK
jgi:hypothetical protein